MNTSFVPSPIDDGSKLESAITKTADFNGTTFDNGESFAPGGLGLPVAAVVDVATFALGGSTGASTWTGQLQDSADGNTWKDIGAAVPITAVGVVSIGGFLSQRYSRLKLDLAGGTGTGTLGLSAWQVPVGRP